MIHNITVAQRLERHVSGELKEYCTTCLSLITHCFIEHETYFRVVSKAETVVVLGSFQV